MRERMSRVPLGTNLRKGENIVRGFSIAKHIVSIRINTSRRNAAHRSTTHFPPSYETTMPFSGNASVIKNYECLSDRSRKDFTFARRIKA